MAHPNPVSRTRPLPAALLLLLPLALFAVACRKPAPPPPPGRKAKLPPILLWAWQEPEDLTALDPQRLGVALLTETILLSGHLTAQPRHQPIRLAPGTRVLSVVRIDAVSGFHDSPQLRSSLVHHLALLSAQPSIAGLQLDFDAVSSQHPFYTAVLRSLRPQMPPTVPLSITALVSWCGSPTWLSSLPIAQAVPMFFRMGGPAVHSPIAPNPLHPYIPHANPSPLPSLAPPCQGSIGLSTDEPWPQLPSGALTLYLFSPSPWSASQIRTLNTLDLNALTLSPALPR